MTVCAYRSVRETNLSLSTEYENESSSENCLAWQMQQSIRDQNIWISLQLALVFVSFHFIKGWDGDDNLEFSFYQQATAAVGEHERVSYFRINFSFTSSPRERKSQMNNLREKGASGHARVPLKPLHLPLSVVHFETERQSAQPASPLPTVYCNDGDDVCCCCCCCCLYSAQPARVLLLWMTLGVNPMHGFLDSIILGPSRPLKQAT